MLQMLELMKLCETFQRNAAAKLAAQQQSAQAAVQQQEHCKEHPPPPPPEGAAAASHMAAPSLPPPVEPQVQEEAKDAPVKPPDNVSAVIDRLMQFDENQTNGQGFNGESEQSIPVFPSASLVEEENATTTAVTQAAAYMASNPGASAHQQEFPQNTAITTADTGNSKDAAKMAQQNATAAVGMYIRYVGHGHETINLFLFFLPDTGQGPLQGV